MHEWEVSSLQQFPFANQNTWLSYKHFRLHKHFKPLDGLEICLIKLAIFESQYCHLKFREPYKVEMIMLFKKKNYIRNQSENYLLL